MFLYAHPLGSLFGKNVKFCNLQCGNFLYLFAMMVSKYLQPSQNTLLLSTISLTLPLSKITSLQFSFLKPVQRINFQNIVTICKYLLDDFSYVSPSKSVKSTTYLWKSYQLYCTHIHVSLCNDKTFFKGF